MDPDADPDDPNQHPVDASAQNQNSRSRKHPRQSSGSSHERPSASRPRYDDEDEDARGRGDNDGYGESSRYRQNGMGNGGVYGMDGYYAPAESSTYTPHLLPMFHQNANFHNVHDSNHLEDASVLLSMAYGGTPTPEPTHPTVQGQRVVADDWGPETNLNMMMEANTGVPTGIPSSDGVKAGTSVGSYGPKSTRDGSTTATSSVDEQATPGDLNHVGNFLTAMNWLGSWAKEGSTPGEGANQWVCDPTCSSYVTQLMSDQSS
jgi:hypothetical protein